MTFKEIGVVGCGAMGADIVQLALKGGYAVIVMEMNEQILTAGLDRVKNGVDKLVRKGILRPEEADAMLCRLSATTAIDNLAACDLIVEAVFEDLQVKKDLFKDLDRICKRETIFASNTSSLSVTDMAASTSRPARFVGMHFFNPATVMPLVEVVKTISTDADVLQSVLDFARSVGKQPVLAKDNAGFIVNLLLTPYLMDAVRAVSAGVASVEDIDMAMRFGCNHPMGPLMLADFIGLDVLAKGAATLFEEYKEKRYAPPPVLKKMVTMGYLGLKTRKGFYDWSDPKHPVPSDLAL